VTDAEWAVALVREAAAALFVSHASARADGRRDAHADPGRHRSLERDGQESPLAYPTVR